MAIWYVLWPFGMLYGHLVCSMAIWYVLWPFGNVVYILYSFYPFDNKKNEALLCPKGQTLSPGAGVKLSPGGEILCSPLHSSK
jgi:hypothetical protein